MEAREFVVIQIDRATIWIVRDSVVAFAKNRYEGTDLYLSGGQHFNVTESFSKVTAWLAGGGKK